MACYSAFKQEGENLADWFDVEFLENDFDLQHPVMDGKITRRLKRLKRDAALKSMETTGKMWRDVHVENVVSVDALRLLIQLWCLISQTRVAQWSTRLTVTSKVVGSNPLYPWRHAWLIMLSMEVPIILDEEGKNYHLVGSICVTIWTRMCLKTKITFLCHRPRTQLDICVLVS